MSCGEIVNFSASAVEGAPLCFYICALRVCVRVCVPQLPVKEHLFSFSPQLPSFSLFSLLTPFSLIPLFFLSFCSSPWAQEPHLFMLPGRRCHLQLLAENFVLKIYTLDKLRKINETRRCPADAQANIKCVCCRNTLRRLFIA